MLHHLISRRQFIAAGALIAAGAAASACSTAPTAPGSAGAADNGQGSTPAEQPQDTEVVESEPEPEPEPQSATDRLLETMTIEQKVAQLFIVTPEGLTGASVATIAGSMTADALARIPVGGICYFGQNITGNQQLRDLLAGTLELSRNSGAGVPAFLSVDEEGGSLVARVANSGHFDVPHFPNMIEIGATGDPSRAAEVGTQIGTYLRDIGFNVDFAPDADVLTNPENPVIGARSFGSDASVVAQMVSAEVEAMMATGVAPCVKHFPGHGDTAGDSHTGAVYTDRTADEIRACELEPFRAAIAADVPFVMVGHIETPNFAADGLPASLSPYMIGTVLREELGFDGVVTTDSFSMGAITQNFAPDDAAVQFLVAGGDVVLMPADLELAYTGVLDAIETGVLTVERIDESVRRVLALKERLGLIA